MHIFFCRQILKKYLKCCCYYYCCCCCCCICVWWSESSDSCFWFQPKGGWGPEGDHHRTCPSPRWSRTAAWGLLHQAHQPAGGWGSLRIFTVVGVEGVEGESWLFSTPLLQSQHSASASCSLTSSQRGRLSFTPGTNTSWWSARCGAG